MGLESLEWRNVNAARAADWLELKALTESRGASSKSELAKSQYLTEGADEHGQDELDDGETTGAEARVDLEIVNVPFESWLDEVYEELHFRSTVLGDRYPFTLAKNGEQWTLSYLNDEASEFASEHLCYTACLLITAVRYGYIASDDDTKSYAKGIDTCLQILAYFAAPSLVRGEAYWFGWPRPDDTKKVHDAVKELFKKMGIKSKPAGEPEWVTGDEKDDGVDIIAWRNFNDNHPGRIIVFGQVASGKTDWKNKSVIEYVRAYFREWLKPFDQASYIPAHFIAWPQYYDERTPEGEQPAVWKIKRASHLERRLGVIVDRLRLTELIHQGRTDDPAEPWADELTKDGKSSHIEFVRTWRTRVLAEARPSDVVA